MGKAQFIWLLFLPTSVFFYNLFISQILINSYCVCEQDIKWYFPLRKYNNLSIFLSKSNECPIIIEVTLNFHK